MTTETTAAPMETPSEMTNTAPAPTPATPTRKPCPKFINGEDGKFRLKDPDAPRLTYREIMGVPDVDAATAEVDRMALVLQMLEPKSGYHDVQNNYLPLIASIGPKDAVEMALATQFVLTHAMTMRLMCFMAGTAKGSSFLLAEKYVNLITKLQRTQVALADALARGREKTTSQTIRIERVDVSDGGQVAMIGKMEPGGGG